MILILLETLVAAAGVDRKRHRRGDCHPLQIDGNGAESEIQPHVRTAIADRNRLGLRSETKKTRGYFVGSRRDVVNRVAAERIGRSIRNHLRSLHYADFGGWQRLSAGQIRDDAGDVGISAPNGVRERLLRR